ncbi:hypothetical protein A3Q56_06958 [Intoshia linei]|uniref:Uncharacterized protein n=1 Tax=Intoshia linei TaxID=1819745 RepID=A0A177ATH5_9BILA|nr:hypothetical protein A3Q56_06958 [Intoshia linei]
MKDTLNCDNIEKNLLKSSSENEDDSNANETRNYRNGDKWISEYIDIHIGEEICNKYDSDGNGFNYIHATSNYMV